MLASVTHSGVITIDGDRAKARFVVRERGKGDGTYYDNLVVYDDVVVRESGAGVSSNVITATVF